MAEANRSLNTSEDLEERIRRCIREELTNNNAGVDRNSNQTLVGRTRDLIRSSATFASRQLGGVTGGLPSRSSQQQNNSMSVVSVPGGRTDRSVPSHSLRFAKRKQNVPAKNSNKKKKQAIPKTVFLLDNVCGTDEEDADVDYEYAIKDEMILLKGEFDLECDGDEASIRSELRKVFSKKFPLICDDNFDFVKRDRNTICTPIVKEGHKWDYAHVKHLCGAGKLYVRLNVSKDTIEDNVGTDIEQSPLIDLSQPSTSSEQSPLIDLSQPSTSSGVQSVDAKITSLAALFPNAKQSDITHVVMIHDNLDAAAEHLSEICNPDPEKRVTSDGSGVTNANLTVPEILKKLKNTLNPYSTAEKIKVDRDDVVMDVFQHYKDSNFDPCVPVKFQIRGEPAVDSGGVLRQVYEEVFQKILKGDCGFQLFQGPLDRVIPTYRSSTILSGTFELFGKIIAHSLVQGGPGFPYFCPALYWYIATGDLQQGVARVSYIDVLDPVLSEYIRKIRDATPSTISSIMDEDDFLQIMQNSGETRLLQENNKLEIVQSLLVHEVILKHKTALDQMRKGLSILGLLAEIEKSPEKFQSLFVHEDDDINAEFIISLLRLPDTSTPLIQNVVQMLVSFINNANKEVLCQFLCFVTGCKSATAALTPGCVDVNVEDVSDIFASTCLLELRLPSSFTNLEQFEACFNAVIDTKTFISSFTTV